ncbi:MAG: toll/interleukin-1 receptor domain-containing protein, partial [Chloroflexota bacterium]
MTKIFISHATTDDAFVNLLENELSIAGFATWIDHNDMPPGVNWVSYLEKMLKECDLMILVCSKASVESTYVQFEWHTFFNMGKKIIPVVIETCPIPPFLSTLHQIDFRKGWCWKENVNTLIKILMEHVKITLFDNKVH